VIGSVEHWAILLNGSCCALAQKCAHGRADPANMSEKLVVFIGPQLDGNSYSESAFIVRVRHSRSRHIASSPEAMSH
jgi:hypothetical protein